MSIIDLIKGNKLYQKDFSALYKQEFLELIAKGQHPKALFIGCADSRVLPNLITNAAPGEIFITRNIGNVVVPFEGADSSMGAVLEFAVGVLNIQDIIVCGHSHCGACRAIYKDIEESFQSLSKWLKFILPARQADFSDKLADNKKQEIYIRTEQCSVIVQSNNLLTYPIVQEKIKINKLRLHTWYLELASGIIYQYDSNASKYLAL